MCFVVVTEERSPEALRDRLERRRRELIDISNALFDVNPPEPEVVTDPRVALELMPELKPLIERGDAHHLGSYVVASRTIVINPAGVISYADSLAKHIIPIQPQLEVERVFAKEYAQHVHSFLNGWQVMKLLDELYQRIADKEFSSDGKTVRGFPRLALPLAISESVGYAAKLKVAKKLQHADNFLGAHLAYLAKEQTHIDSFSMPTPANMSYILRLYSIMFGRALGHSLSLKGDERLRAFAKLPLHEAYEVAVKELLGSSAKRYVNRVYRGLFR